MFAKSSVSVSLLSILFFLLSACGTSVIPVTCNGHESVALDAFRQFAENQQIPYKQDRVGLQTLSNDCTYATVRITAWFRPTEQSEWIEKFADVEVRNVGGKWSANTTMYFQDTPSTQQTKTAVANVTSTSVFATRFTEQATYAAMARETTAVASTKTAATQVAASATWVAATAAASSTIVAKTAAASTTETAKPLVAATITSLLNKFIDAGKRGDCNTLWQMSSTSFQQTFVPIYYGTKERFCEFVSSGFRSTKDSQFQDSSIEITSFDSDGTVETGIKTTFSGSLYGQPYTFTNARIQIKFLNDGGWRLSEVYF